MSETGLPEGSDTAPETPGSRNASPAEPAGGAERVGRAAAACSVAVLAAAILLRVIDLGHLPAFMGDEGYFGVMMAEYRSGRPLPAVVFSGHLQNPFYVALHVATHAVFGAPRLWMLRVPAVVSSLLFLGLAYLVVRKTHGRAAALGVTTLAAALPVHVALGRWGTEHCQLGLAAAACFWFAWNRRIAGAVVAFLAAFLVHPTAVFLLPFLLGPELAAALALFGRSAPAARRRLARNGLLAAGAAVPLGLAFVWWVIPRKALPHPGDFFGRLCDLPGWLSFAQGFGRLLSGVSLYADMAKPVSPLTVALADAGAALALIGLAAVAVPAAVRGRHWRELGLAGGLAAGTAAYYPLAGAHVMAEDQKWAVVLGFPTCLVAVLLLRAWARERPARGRWAAAGPPLVAGLLLAGFVVNFHLVQKRGAGSLPTGPREPKEAALELVFARAPAPAPLTVITDDYNNYVCLRYLGSVRPAVRVVALDPVSQRLFPHDPAPRTALRYAIGPPGGPAARAAEAGGHRRVGTVPDYAGRAALEVWETVPR